MFPAAYFGTNSTRSAVGHLKREKGLPVVRLLFCRPFGDDNRVTDREDSEPHGAARAAFETKWVPGADMPIQTIDVVSDVVCPWCFIGKRRLERALDLYAAARPDACPRVTWRPFELNPDLPPEGVNRADYYRRKFGDRVEEIVARVAAAGRTAAIDFCFDRIERQPNTLAMHALIEHAADEGAQDAVVEAFFRAFFLDGIDLTDRANVKSVAVAAGLDGTHVDEILASDGARARIAARESAARRLGVQGVPYFIFDGRVAVSGAHEPEVLLEAMLQAEPV